MKVSELTAALQKVQQIAGDFDVVLRQVETEAETVLATIGLHINPTTSDTGSTIVLEHGTTTPGEPAAQPPVVTAPPAGD